MVAKIICDVWQFSLVAGLIVVIVATVRTIQAIIITYNASQMFRNAQFVVGTADQLPEKMPIVRHCKGHVINGTQLGRGPKI